MRIIRCAALTLALAILPACSSLPFGPFTKQASISRVQSLEIQAYALVETYSTALDAAARLVAQPSTPAPVITALARAEAVATPAAAALLGALRAYARAGQSPESAPTLSAAGQNLARAMEAARGPITALSSAAGE